MRKMGLLLAALAVTTLALGRVALAQARGVIECDPGEPVCGPAVDFFDAEPENTVLDNCEIAF
jgi:hypothetical protein